VRHRKGVLARSGDRSAVRVSWPEDSADTPEPLGVVAPLTGSQHRGGPGVAPLPLQTGIQPNGARATVDARAALADTRTGARIGTQVASWIERCRSVIGRGWILRVAPEHHRTARVRVTPDRTPPQVCGAPGRDDRSAPRRSLRFGPVGSNSPPTQRLRPREHGVASQGLFRRHFFLHDVPVLDDPVTFETEDIDDNERLALAAGIAAVDLSLIHI